MLASKSLGAIAMTIHVRLDGWDQVKRKLGEVGALQFLRGIMAAAAADVKSWVAVYPPSSIANSPGNPTGRWYERGYGPRWRRRDGTAGGMRTSQGLGRMWTTQVDPDGKRAVIGNRVAYGPFVQDETKQAWFHKARGWRTVQGAAKEKAPDIIRKIKEAIERIWRG